MAGVMEGQAIVLEETPDRLKVSLPVQRSAFLLGLFSVALIVWVASLVVMGRYLLTGQSPFFVLTVLIILWLLVWLWFGRYLWNRWQYFAADREILFADKEQIILRRPVSILGLTSNYDRRHVTPFYFSDKHHCLAFDYAYAHVYFGHSLARSEAEQLAQELNDRLFPGREA